MKKIIKYVRIGNLIKGAFDFKYDKDASLEMLARFLADDFRIFLGLVKGQT